MMFALLVSPSVCEQAGTTYLRPTCRELADNWVLLYNGVTTLQDIAAGSGDQTIVREPEQMAAFLELVGELQ